MQTLDHGAIHAELGTALHRIADLEADNADLLTKRSDAHRLLALSVSREADARRRIADLESLATRLADALAHACDRLERCDARLLRLTGQPCEGPLGEVVRGRTLVDEACLSQLRGSR